MSREIIEAVRAIEREKGIDGDDLLNALEDALLAAYHKTEDAVAFARVEIDRETGVFRLHQFVGDELPDEALIILENDEDDAQSEATPAAGDAPLDGEEEEEDEIKFDLDWSKVPIEAVESSEITPDDSFGRIAAQTAKQVILQRIRDAERGIMYDEYIDRVGELVTGIVQQSDRGITLVDLGRAEAILPYSEGIPGERHDHGSRVKAVILEVRTSPKGPQIVLSRGSDEVIRRLFELEVPEIADGLVTIRSVAREPGYRSKIAVESHTQGVDPVGACVGPRGSRVRMVVSELRGEKIDIIPYNDEPARFIAKALSPARVREVLVDDEDRQATVIVPDDQLALAIGREGQNARLAARLTGWRIDIRSSAEHADDEKTPTMEEGDEAGRCKAIMKTGKRCPNAAVAGSDYCSLPHHQALANGESALADGDAAPAEGITAVGEGAAEAAEASLENGAADSEDEGQGEPAVGVSADHADTPSTDDGGAQPAQDGQEDA